MGSSFGNWTQIPYSRLQTIKHQTSNLVFWRLFTFWSDGLNYVQSLIFECLKPKIGCSSLITKRWTRLSPFDVWKSDVQVWSMNNSVNLVNAFSVQCPFVWIQNSGVRVRSSIGEHVRVRVMFEKWCSSLFDVWWNGVQPIISRNYRFVNSLDKRH